MKFGRNRNELYDKILYLARHRKYSNNSRDVDFVCSFIRKLDRIVLFGSYMGILLQMVRKNEIFKCAKCNRKMGIEKDESCRQNFCKYV